MQLLLVIIDVDIFQLIYKSERCLNKYVILFLKLSRIILLDKTVDVILRMSNRSNSLIILTWHDNTIRSKDKTH